MESIGGLNLKRPEECLHVTYDVNELPDGSYEVTRVYLRINIPYHFVTMFVSVEGECVFKARELIENAQEIYTHIVFEDIYYRPIDEIIAREAEDMLENKIQQEKWGMLRTRKMIFSDNALDWVGGKLPLESELLPTVSLLVEHSTPRGVKFTLSLIYRFVVESFNRQEFQDEVNYIKEFIRRERRNLETLLSVPWLDGVISAYAEMQLTGDEGPGAYAYIREHVKSELGPNSIEVKLRNVEVKFVSVPQFTILYQEVPYRHRLHDLSILYNPGYITFFFNWVEREHAPLLKPFLKFISYITDETKRDLITVEVKLVD